MLRAAEFTAFLAPLLAFAMWRIAVARGMDGPPPRQLIALFAALLLLGVTLASYAVDEALPPGRYVPAVVQDGKLIPGHTE